MLRAGRARCASGASAGSFAGAIIAASAAASCATRAACTARRPSWDSGFAATAGTDDAASVRSLRTTLLVALVAAHIELCRWRGRSRGPIVLALLLRVALALYGAVVLE